MRQPHDHRLEALGKYLQRRKLIHVSVNLKLSITVFQEQKDVTKPRRGAPIERPRSWFRDRRHLCEPYEAKYH
jgi:hypothetical protein